MYAMGYDMRGVNTDDQDLYRVKDARVTCNFDRTKYAFNNYYFGQHYQASIRRLMSERDHPDDPRVINIIFQLKLIN